MSQSKMTRKDVRGAIIGMVLGDGSLFQNPYRDGSKRGNYKLSIAHSVKQADYLSHKRDIVNAMFDYRLPIKSSYHTAKKGNSKKYPVVRMQTRVHSRLSFIAKKIYDSERKKRISDWALDNISLEGLAYWWMDDGCLALDKRPNHGGGDIIWGLYGFPKEDVEKFQQWLLDRFNISLRLYVHKKSGGIYLGRGISEGRKLLNLIDEYKIPCMEYKFNYKNSLVRPHYSLSKEIVTAHTPSVN